MRARSVLAVWRSRAVEDVAGGDVNQGQASLDAGFRYGGWGVAVEDHGGFPLALRPVDSGVGGSVDHNRGRCGVNGKQRIRAMGEVAVMTANANDALSLPFAYVGELASQLTRLAEDQNRRSAHPTNAFSGEAVRPRRCCW